MKVLFIAGFAHDQTVYARIQETLEKSGDSSEFITLEESRLYPGLEVEDFDVICCHSLAAKSALENGWHTLVPTLFMAPVLTRTAISVETVSSLLKLVRAFIPEGIQRSLSKKTVTTDEDALLVTTSFMDMDGDVCVDQLNWLKEKLDVELYKPAFRGKIVTADGDKLAYRDDATLLSEKLDLECVELSESSHTLHLDKEDVIIEMLRELARK